MNLVCWFWCCINRLLTYLVNFLTYLLTSLLVYFLKNTLVPFLGRRQQEATKPGFSFCDYFALQYILLRMHVYFCCGRFNFSVLSQENGWKERLRNNLFCVGCNRKPQLSQSINNESASRLTRDTMLFPWSCSATQCFGMDLIFIVAN